MAAGHDAQAAGERVEALLAELRSQAGPQVADTAEELVGCLVELYGAGLAEIVRILGEDAEAGRGCWTGLVADPLVESLLLVHDLHPLDAGTRVQRAHRPGPAPARLACGPGRVPRHRRRRASSTCAWTQRRPRLRIVGRHGPGGHREGGDGGGTGGGRRRHRGGRGQRPNCRCCRSPGARRGPGVPGDLVPGYPATRGDRAAPLRQAAGPAPRRPAPRQPSGRTPRPRGHAWTRAAIRIPGPAEDRREAERCEMCREVLRPPARARARGGYRQAVARLHLPRVLPALHPSRARRRPVPGGARARPRTTRTGR